jgi:signal transduction histidine kinase
MKLARKLTIALVLSILVVMAGHAWIQWRSEVILFQNDIDRLPKRGRAFLGTVQQIWMHEGEQRARQIVEEVADAITELDARWVRLDAAPGDPDALKLSPEEMQRVADGHIVRAIIHEPDDRMRRYTYLPVDPHGPNVLEVAESLDKQQSYVRTTHLGMAAATILIALACGANAMVLGVRFVGKPVAELRDKARRISAGDFSGRLEVHQRDEIGELAEEMNAMSDQLEQANRRILEETQARLAALEQLRHTDRLATVGQLAAGVAHELGTPLSIVAARAALLTDGTSSQTDVVENAKVIGEQAQRMTGIIRQLLDFSRRRSAQLDVADVQRIVARTLDLLASASRARHISVDSPATTAPLLARIDASQIQQALANIVVNAIQALPEGGRLAVRVATERARPPSDPSQPESEWVCITVRDEGPGIAPEHLPRIFEPFFTTKDVGQGTGLGLSVAHGIVTDHGGWLGVESTPGDGTTFRVFLPVLAQADEHLGAVS